MSFVKFGCLLFLLAFLWVGNRAMAQANCSYVIVANGGYTQAQIDQAFGAANLDGYRLKTLRRAMKFANGAEVQLYAADELQVMQCPVNSGLAMDDNTPLDPDRRFEIHASGVIYESVQAVYKR
jgi:hypothetical protein